MCCLEAPIKGFGITQNRLAAPPCRINDIVLCQGEFRGYGRSSTPLESSDVGLFVLGCVAAGFALGQNIRCVSGGRKRRVVGGNDQGDPLLSHSVEQQVRN